MIDFINDFMSVLDIINTHVSSPQINFIFPSQCTEAGCALYQVVSQGLISKVELRACTEFLIHIYRIEWVDQQREIDWNKDYRDLVAWEKQPKTGNQEIEKGSRDFLFRG